MRPDCRVMKPRRWVYHPLRLASYHHSRYLLNHGDHEDYLIMMMRAKTMMIKTMMTKTMMTKMMRTKTIMTTTMRTKTMMTMMTIMRISRMHMKKGHLAGLPRSPIVLTGQRCHRLHEPMKYNAVQYGALRCNTLQCCTKVHYSAIQYNAI